LDFAHVVRKKYKKEGANTNRTSLFLILSRSPVWAPPQLSRERQPNRQQKTRLQSIRDLKRRTSFSQLPSIQQDHGASKPLNWCKKLGDAPLSSQMTAEKPPSCFRGCPWLCRGEMQSHS